MSSKKYIHVDSSYRDREQYPNPAEFAVNIRTGQEIQVSESSMLYPIPTNTNNYAYPISKPAPNVLNIDYTFVDNQTFISEIPIQRADNTFTGNILEIFNDDPGLTLPPIYAKITSSLYKNQSLLLETGYVYASINMVQASLIINPPNPLTAFYLAPGSSDIDNYYVNKSIVINTQTRTVVSYDGGRRLLYINEPLSSPPLPGDLFQIYGSEQWSLITDKTLVLNQVPGINFQLTITNHLPNTGGWSSYFLAYSPSLNMVVAPYNVRTSIDGGVNWVDTLYTGQQGIGICWADDLAIFVIVFNYDIGGGAYAITFDGTTGTPATTNVPGNWAGVAYSPELSMFVAMNNNAGSALAMLSNDGLTWVSSATADVSGLSFWAIAYSPPLSLFVATAQNASINNIQTFDGTTWTVQNNSSGAFLDNIIWVPFISKFVAIGGNNCLTSDDGVNWDIQTVPGNPGYWYNITYSEELSVIVVASTFQNKIMYSYNAINWLIADDSGFGGYEATFNILWVPNTETFILQAQFPVDATIIATPSLLFDPLYPSHLINNYPVFTRNLYRIRNNGIPSLSATATGPNNSNTTIQLPPTASSVDDYYKGQWIWVTNQERLVHQASLVFYSFPTHYETFTLWDVNEIKISPAALPGVLQLGMRVVIKTTWDDSIPYLLVSYISDRLGITLNLLDEFYILAGFPQKLAIGDIVYVYKPNPNLNQYRQIIAYDGTTKVATFQSLNASVEIGDTFEILPVNNTKRNCFDTAISNQPVCYEMELQCLTLPNLHITTSTGGIIAFYPYVYVEFQSLISKTYYSALQSNVPNITDVLFKVPIYAVNNPEISAFVVLDGRGMVHTIKFKSDDTFLVRVLLPNGELFTTVQPDTMPPIVCLDKIQISLTIGFKRLV